MERLRNFQELAPGRGRTTASEHLPKDFIGVRSGALLTQRILVVQPGVHDDLLVGVEPIEEAVSAVPGPVPVSVRGPESVALPESRGTRIAGNLPDDQSVHGRQEPGGGMLTVSCKILRPKPLYLLDELPESQPKSTPPEQAPPTGGRDRGMHLLRPGILVIVELHLDAFGQLLGTR